MSAPIPLPAAPEPLVAAAREALAQHATLFRCRGALVEVQSGRIVPLRRSRIRCLLEANPVLSAAEHRQVPGWLIAELLADPGWPGLRELAGVTDVPVLRPDGTL